MQVRTAESPPASWPTKIARFLRRVLYLVAMVWHYTRQRVFGRFIRQVLAVWRREGFPGLWRVALEFHTGHASYDEWVLQSDALTEHDRAAIRAHVAELRNPPLISVLMPVFNTPEVWLRHAIESVRAQLYPYWELCIADDASSLPHVHEVLEEYRAQEPRVKVAYRETNRHICAASNTALSLARGEFIALLDHDDELAEHALYMVASALENNPHLDVIYSDEDRLDERGGRFTPYFKPDWNPDLFTSQNMISHLGVFRTELVRALGGFRTGFEGSQDWDLALRIIERVPPAHIHHIPFILYHWRTIPGSTSLGVEAKPYAVQAARRALEEHLQRTGVRGLVEVVQRHYFRIRYALPADPPRVSVIIPTRNGLRLLERCLGSLRRLTDYPRYEILVIDNQSDDPAVVAYLRRLARDGVARVLRYDAPFNYAAINNFAVAEAAGEILCLLNNDTEIISPDWLTEMTSHALRPEIGAVGAMLYYPDDTLQHAGVILGLLGVAGHWHRGEPRGTRGYFCRTALVQNLSAVTAACMVLRKDVYLEVGGMDENNLAVAFNDVDFCLRIRAQGYQILWTPFAELYHHESVTRGNDLDPDKYPRFERECAYMKSRWGEILERDPAFNPNLRLDHVVPGLAPTPRVPKPWLRLK